MVTVPSSVSLTTVNGCYAII